MPLLGLYEHLVAKRYHGESRADEVHRVRCPDDLRVAVKRFRPAAGAPARRVPVLCVPGLGADSHNFDAPGRHGLAPWLAERGFDVWVVDLRGTGLSMVAPARWSEITFDDFAHLDLPAVIDHVCAVTRAPEVMGMGHSMGGMLLYALLASDRGARVGAAVTIASPIGFPQGWAVAPVFRPVWWIGEYIPGLHAGRFLRVAAPLAMRSADFVSRRFAVPANIDGRYARRLLHRAVQNIPRGVCLQFRDWIMNDVFRSADQTVDYRARLCGVQKPVLVALAPEDQLAKPEAVRRAMELLDGGELLVCGTDDGLSCDYGHIDVIFGHRAPDEVFPRILDFMARYDRDAPVPSDEASAAARVH